MAKSYPDISGLYDLDQGSPLPMRTETAGEGNPCATKWAHETGSKTAAITLWRLGHGPFEKPRRFRASSVIDSGYLSPSHRSHERGMIALCLVRIGQGELSHCGVECIV